MKALPRAAAVDYLAVMMRPCFLVFVRAALMAAGVLLSATLMAGGSSRPAAAQTSSAVLSEALAAELARPLTPPESWAVAQAVRDHSGPLRDARSALAARVAAAVNLPTEEVLALLPPLGRGPQSVLRPLAPVLADHLARPLSAAEQAGVAAAERDHAASLAPHRENLTHRVEVLTGVPASRVLPLLAACGL